jgi:multicomponent Na+:H+ antiporter subunit B
MDLRRSQIVQTSVRKLFPFAVVFSMYVFSYGANFPGGGFQAGVIFGTIVVVFELSLDRRIGSGKLYEIIEFVGIVILVFCMVYGYVRSGFLFGGFYRFTTDSMLFSSIYYWILNLAIYLEVLASMVLIFRGFIEWRDDR